MPPVVLFNKEWRIGSDDFVFSSVFETLIRGGWAVSLALILGFHMQELTQLECMGKEYRYTTSYLIVALIMQPIMAINLILMGHASAQGQMFDKRIPHPRRHVSTYLYINFFLTLAEFSATVAGTVFAVKDAIRCGTDASFRYVIVFVLGIIGLTYILLLVKLICVITAFKPFSKKIRDNEREPLAKELRMKNEQILTYRGLRCLMFWTRDESTLEAFREISAMLSKIFHDDMMVPSDIAAGLLLLHYKHSHAKELDSGIQPTIRSNNDRMSTDMSEVKYFYKYSLAAYGCWWYIVDNPCGHLCSLGSYLSYCPCFPCMKDQSQIIKGDSCFNMNLAAAKALLKDTNEDFIVFDNRNRVQEVPYLLCVDHEKQSVIISIRGTMSIADMFTDLRAECSPLSKDLPDIEMDASLYGHKGMVHAARYVYLRLHGLPVDKDDEKKDRNERKNILKMTLDEYQDYSIVVTGHSLGAGTAVILGFILRQKYKDKDVKCYAFSPPGGLLSTAAAEESTKFTVTLIAGDDVIPRLSLPNIAKLADEIRTVTEKCQLPKYKLFGHGLMALLCCAKSDTISGELDRMYQEEREHAIAGGGDEVGVHLNNLEDGDITAGEGGNKTEVAPAEEQNLMRFDSTSSHNSPEKIVSVQPYCENQLLVEVDQHPAGAGTFQDIERVVDIERKEVVADDNIEDREDSTEQIALKRVSFDNSGQELLEKSIQQICKVSVEGASSLSSPTPEMFPPGRIYYLVDEEEECHILTPDRLHFQQILVSPRMLQDHLPGYLDKLISKAKLD